MHQRIPLEVAVPKEYKECVKSEISRGHSEKDAQRICAIAYFKRHGRTPQQDEKASFNQHELNLFEGLNAIGTALGPNKNQ
jgi:hypothetical protein